MPSALNDRQRRHELTRRVLRDIAVGGKVESLRIQLDDGTKPVVVALHHELLSDVMQRVTNAGGAANVFVEMSDNTILLALMRTNGHIPATVDNAEDLGNEPIHEDISIGMFVTVTAQYAAGVLATIRLPRHSGQAEIVGKELATA